MKKTILIVDDEDVVVDIARRRLSEHGYNVIGASDGEAALLASRDTLVDLIILDVEMPKMNGYAFMAERDKNPGENKAPVIVLTAYDSMEPIFKRHGVSSYLVKPLRFDDLLLKIKEVIGEA